MKSKTAKEHERLEKHIGEVVTEYIIPTVKKTIDDEKWAFRKTVAKQTELLKELGKSILESIKKDTFKC